MSIQIETQTDNTPLRRYHSLTIVLHWLMAVGILMMLVSGAIMTRVDFDGQFELYQIHKSVGVLLMWMLIIRLIVRSLTKAPAIPDHFPRIEQLAAKAGHLGLYVFMFVMVVTGWVMVSSSVIGLPTIVFGWFEWPHLPFVEQSETIEDLTKKLHFYSAVGLGLLLVGHVGAVVKHYLFDSENLVRRMWWEEVPLYKAVIPVVLVMAMIFLSSQFELAVETETPTSTPTMVTPVVRSPEGYMFTVNKTQSRVAFEGLHEGDRFQGFFKNWDAKIKFNPEALSDSFVQARFKTDTATTGNIMYDSTLLEEDWFDVETYPEALFESGHMSLNDDGSYKIQGLLTIKDISHPISFDVKISDLSQTPVSVNGAFSIDRLSYQIGVSSDPEGEWVSTEIKVQLTLVATRP